MEGVLMMSPRPRLRHADASVSVILQLAPQLPTELKVVAEVEVDIDVHYPPTVRVPDLLVCRRDIGDRRSLDPADVVLAIEIVSPGSRRTDHVVKRSEYEEAGIPFYWIIDLDHEPVLTALALTDSGYTATIATHDYLCDKPFPARIDLSALIA